MLQESKTYEGELQEPSIWVDTVERIGILGTPTRGIIGGAKFTGNYTKVER